MRYKQLATAAINVYIVLVWGLKRKNTKPTLALARAVYDHRFVDTASDGSVYHMKAYLRQHAPELSEAQAIQFVLEVLKVQWEDAGRVGGITSPAKVPPSLRKYLS